MDIKVTIPDNKKHDEIIIGFFIIRENKITFQRSNYIESGWYVEQINEDIVLWEIPEGGGKPMRIGSYCDLIIAIKSGIKLT